MNLRELMTQRILDNITEEELSAYHDISPAEIRELSDEDFLDLYEELFGFQG